MTKSAFPPRHSAAFGVCFLLLSAALHAAVPNDEVNRKLCEGVYYTGTSAKRHVPDGFGTLTLQTTDPTAVPEVVIAGVFDGDRILIAVLCQDQTLLFHGNLRYAVHSRKGLTLQLENGDIFDEDGNLRYVIFEDEPVNLTNAHPDNPALLLGQGSVLTYVSPLMTSAVTRICTLDVDGRTWDVSPGKLYSASFSEGPDGFSEVIPSPIELSPDYDAFGRIAGIEGGDLLSTLAFMKESVPMTKKGFKYNTPDNGDNRGDEVIDRRGGVIVHTHKKDIVYLENGAWCFQSNLPIVDALTTTQQRYLLWNSQYVSPVGLQCFNQSKEQ